MATASIGGLGSGLDTAGIVSQLMSLEAAPQARLQKRATTEGYLVESFQSLNSKLAALVTKATSTGSSDAWNALRTSSSLTGVSVAATSTAVPASFAVKVGAVATSHGETYLGTAGPTDVVVPADVDGKRLLTVTHANGTTATIDTGDGTLRSVVDALNASGNESGVRATMLQVSPGVHRLVVDATATGAQSGFTLTTDGGAALLGGPEASRTRAGVDAQIEVSGFTLTSSSNTFTDIMPGVSVTLAPGTEVGKTSQVSVTRDASTLASSVKSLIDNVNAILSEIDTKSTYNTATSTRGDFVGDPVVRTIRNELANSVYPGNNSSMAALGLQIDRTGKLVLDEAAFKKAYEADPAAVAAAFGTSGDGFAARVKAVADRASNKTDGTLTSSIEGRNKGIERLNASIADWDRRLELREAALTRQFTALDVALSKMGSQSSWLTSQIASLTASSSS